MEDVGGIRAKGFLFPEGRGGLQKVKPSTFLPFPAFSLQPPSFILHILLFNISLSIKQKELIYKIISTLSRQERL